MSMTKVLAGEMIRGTQHFRVLEKAPSEKRKERTDLPMMI